MRPHPSLLVAVGLLCAGAVAWRCVAVGERARRPAAVEARAREHVAAWRQLIGDPAFPSSHAGRAALTGGFDADAISVYVDPVDWSDPETGIYSNPHARGTAWERAACLSMFAAGELVAETTIGLRIHGGRSRDADEKSLRLVFDPLYRPALAPGDVLRGASGDTLVLHNDRRRLHFVNPIVYELAAGIGADAPLTRPVRLVVNGVIQTHVFFVTEHLSRSFVRARLGHDDFDYFKAKSSEIPKRYRDDIARIRGRFTLTEDAARIAHVDDVVNWALIALFSGAWDASQGIAYRDRRASEPRWRWVLWDLDAGLGPWPDEAGLAENAAADLIRPTYDLRALLLRQLLSDDRAFRADFAARVAAAANHDFAFARVRPVLERYREIGRRYGGASAGAIAESLDAIAEFARSRPERMCTEAGRSLGLGRVHRCTVTAPPDRTVRIDGRLHGPTYEGLYFAGQTIRVEVDGPDCAWRLNGRAALPGTAIEVPVEGDLQITAEGR